MLPSELRWRPRSSSWRAISYPYVACSATNRQETHVEHSFQQLTAVFLLHLGWLGTMRHMLLNDAK